MSGNFTDIADGTLATPANLNAPLQELSDAIDLLVSKDALVYDVTDYGATGLGLVDDGPSIQLCANAIATAGGGTMYFPRGSYIVNTQVTCASSDLTIDFGDAKILNTNALVVVARNGFDTNPLFLLTGHRVKIFGGHFLNGFSQCIVITGDFTSGDTYTGADYTEGHRVEGTIFENCEGDSLHIRFFRNIEVRGITVRDKGAGLESAHAAEVAALYGTDARFVGCSVDDARNGGALYGLYVDGLVWSGCYADVTNADSGSEQSCDAYYAQYCKDISLTGSQGYALTGGTAFKASVGCERVTVTGCTMEVAGSSTDPYATILIQGVNGFTITGNDLKSPVSIHTVRVEFHTTPETNSRAGRVASNRIEGGGVYVSMSTAVTRDFVDVVDNRMKNGSIYALQISPTGAIAGNQLYTATDYETTDERAAIFADRCYGVIVERNFALNESAVNEAKVGVLVNIPSYNIIRDNTIVYTTEVALSVGYELTGSPTGTYWERNESSGSGQAYKGITTASQLASVSGDWGDSAATLTVGESSETNRWASPIAADRAVTLSTTGAYNGARFRIVRTAAATGASNLNVGTGPLKALAVGEWCEVEYNGSAWMLTAYGSL